MHHHVQAVTVLEATHPENTPIIKRNGVTAIKRNVYKDSNNNVQPITKSSLNVKTPKSDEATEYTLLGFIKFKSPIKWLNSISIILIHLIFLYGFFTYPSKGKILTTLWGEFDKFFAVFKNNFYHKFNKIRTNRVVIINFNSF
jgi:hypothetical protein